MTQHSSRTRTSCDACRAGIKQLAGVLSLEVLRHVEDYLHGGFSFRELESVSTPYVRGGQMLAYLFVSRVKVQKLASW